MGSFTRNFDHDREATTSQIFYSTPVPMQKTHATDHLHHDGAKSSPFPRSFWVTRETASSCSEYVHNYILQTRNKHCFSSPTTTYGTVLHCTVGTVCTVPCDRTCRTGVTGVQESRTISCSNCFRYRQQPVIQRCRSTPVDWSAAADSVV